MALCLALTSSQAQSKDRVLEVRYAAASGGLRMRVGPDVKAKPVELIPNGDRLEVVEFSKKVKIDGREGQWLRVLWKKKKGYVFGGYVTRTAPEEVRAEVRPFIGYWKGSFACEQNNSHLLIHPDGTFTGWVFGGAEAGGCGGTEVSGSYVVEPDEDAEQCIVLKGENEGEVVTFAMESAPGKKPTLKRVGESAWLLENYDSEVLNGLVKK